MSKLYNLVLWEGVVLFFETRCHFVTLEVLKSQDIPTSFFQVLGLKGCATMPGSCSILLLRPGEGLEQRLSSEEQTNKLP